MHLITHNGNTYSPNGRVDIDPATVEQHNAEQDAADVEWITAAAAAGAPITLYLGKDENGWMVTTWRGTIIGRAWIVSSWKRWSWISDRMYAVNAKIHGRNYYGRNGGEGICINLYANKI